MGSIVGSIQFHCYVSDTTRYLLVLQFLFHSNYLLSGPATFGASTKTKPDPSADV